MMNDPVTRIYFVYALIAFIAISGFIYVRFFDKDEEDLETA